VDAGIAVAVVFRASLRPGWRILGAREGFPNLPDLGIILQRSSHEQPELVDRLVDHIGGSSRPACRTAGSVRTPEPVAGRRAAPSDDQRRQRHGSAVAAASLPRPAADRPRCLLFGDLLAGFRGSAHQFRPHLRLGDGDAFRGKIASTRLLSCARRLLFPLAREVEQQLEHIDEVEIEREGAEHRELLLGLAVIVLSVLCCRLA
jgi:hypothetical protein